MFDLRRDFSFEKINFKNYINLSLEEKELVRTWRNHESIRRWMYSDDIISPEMHSNFIESLKTNNKNYYWLVQTKNGENIGVVSLNKIDFRHKNAYIGIYSNPFNKSKGKGKLLLDFLKKLAFEVAQFHTLKLEVLNNNEPAISFYKKIGFTEEGKLRDFVLKNGEWQDVLVMGIINREF